MAEILETDLLEKQLPNYPVEVRLWAYNGFDVLIPHDVFREVGSKMNPRRQAAYEFMLAMQGPAASMMITGVKVSEYARRAMIATFMAQQEILEKYVHSLVTVWWGKALNVRSADQMKEFFYYDEAGFKLPPRYTGKGISRRVTTERPALEAIAKENYYAQPIINGILALKDVLKKLEFLERGVDADGRVRCSFNVSATETGRWSSSQNPFGRGGNFQNQTEDVRKIYKPDDGYIFAYPDLEQAESRGVAYYSGDENYIKAVESGDVHTAVARMMWPELPWTGDLKKDRKLAEQNFYRHFSRRDLTKRGGHATNYLGKPFTVARNIGIEQDIVETFQLGYFKTFFGIPLWHKEVQNILQTTGVLATALGRERTFFGRLNSDETLKEAVAALPQGLISDIVKIGAFRAWRAFQLGLERPLVNLLADMHDGTLLQILKTSLDEVVPKLIQFYTIPVKMPKGHIMTIPVEFKVGYRWSKDKMVPWTPGVLASLEEPSESEDLLEMPAVSFQR